jgi:hypothetical protein
VSAGRGVGGPIAIAAVVLVAVLAAVLLVVNGVVARNAEEQAIAEASAALGAPAEVRLSGFPIGLRLLAGAPLEAEVRARDVPLDAAPARLARLEILARDVVLDRRDGVITAGSATFIAELDEQGVRDMLGILGRIPLTQVELANGVARFSVAGFALVDATATVEGGDVVFRLTAPIGNLGNVRLELADLPLGFRPTEVEIRRGVLRLRGSATDLRLEDEGSIGAPPPAP